MPTDAAIPAIRHFNRFYTRQIGVLQAGMLESPLSLNEVRLLYELAHHPAITATRLSQDLGLDPGYLSRALREFGRRGWIRRKPSTTDRRQVMLALTRRGSATLRPLEERSNRQVEQMLAAVSADRQPELLEAMRRIEQILAPGMDRPDPFLLRPHQSGDLGWMVYRHGILYSREYRYDERFEALVAQIAAHFIEHFDAGRDRCWIAERSGERAGSVMLVHKTRTLAKLRLLIVEPSARGLGIGKRLVEECIRFARQAGYRKIVLWTQSELSAARAIYEKAGFQLVHQQPHQSWGRDDLVAETWELPLRQTGP